MLEPWIEEDYWAFTDKRGRVLARIQIEERRLKAASPEKRIQDEVAFLNRQIADPRLRWPTAEQFLLEYSRSLQNYQAAVQVRPMFH